MSFKKRNKFGLNKRLSKAIDSMSDIGSGGRRRIDGNSNLMKLRFLVSKGKRTPLAVNVSGYTGCTAGAIFPNPIRYFDLGEDDVIEYITSELPTRVLDMFNGKTGLHKEAYAYYHWLFNESPYKEAYVVKSVDKVIKIGQIIVRADLDNRIVAEALMCTRYIWEDWCKNFCKLFSDLVDGGVSGNMAWQMTYFLKQSDTTLKAYSSWGHSAPQNNMLNSETLARFVCVGRMLKQPKSDYIDKYAEINRYHHTVECEEPNILTFSKVGGFISGYVSKGWGEYVDSPKFNVMGYIKSFIDSISATEEQGCNLFNKAFEKYTGTGKDGSIDYSEENIKKLCLFLIQFEKHLRNGTKPVGI